MTKRLQVLLEEDEFDEIKAAAKLERQTVSEWVRQRLRGDRSKRPPGAYKSQEEKLRALHEASKHSYPTCDIDQMLAEIEKGRWE